MECSTNVLKRILSQYVEVTVSKQALGGIDDTPTPQNLYSKADSEKSSPCLLPKFKVEHARPLYCSAEESKEILNKNKSIFEKMSDRLKLAENTSYNQILASTHSDLMKLKSFKCRSQRRNFTSSLIRKTLDPSLATTRKQKLLPLPSSHASNSSDSSTNSHFLPPAVLAAGRNHRLPEKWTQHKTSGYFAEAREGASLTTLMLKGPNGIYEERIYLFGGLSREI